MAGNARVKIFSMLWTTLWKDMFYKDRITLGVCCRLQNNEFVEKLTLTVPPKGR